MRRLPQDEFQQRVRELRDRHLLSEVLAPYTTLRPRGPYEKVGLCPFHDEKSPSFEVNDDKGTWHCFGCGEGGDAISFLMAKHGLSFVDACRSLDESAFPVITEADRARRRANNAGAKASRIALARSIWETGSNPAGTAAETYFRHARGLDLPLPSSVRFGLVARFRDPDTGVPGRAYPAVICALQDASGEVAGVQCIWLEAGGRRKYSRLRKDGSPSKAKLSYGQLVGSAFRAADRDGNTLVLCEGPEDALTLAQELPISVWATCGTDLLGQVHVPPRVQEIVLAGDNNDAGRHAVSKAAGIYAAKGLRVRTMYPDEGYKDFNDQLRDVVQ